MKKLNATLILIAFFFSTNYALAAQNGQPTQNAAAAEREAAGDQPDDPGPLATNLSPKLKRSAILKAMKSVADWQLKLRTDEAHGKGDGRIPRLVDDAIEIAGPDRR